MASSHELNWHLPTFASLFELNPILITSNHWDISLRTTNRATAMAIPQPITNGVVDQNTATPPTISTWSSTPSPSVESHPQAAEIIRQIDFYFSDDNLRQDAHLLGLFKEGKGTVSLNEILSFSKMRQFKPPLAVKEAVKQSTVVEVIGKRLKRRYPLTKPLLVTPRTNLNCLKKVVPEDKPWLTKAMLEPTGFEEYATDGPVKPQEYEDERRGYDPGNAFTLRIEVRNMKDPILFWRSIPTLQAPSIILGFEAFLSTLY